MVSGHVRITLTQISLCDRTVWYGVLHMRTIDSGPSFYKLRAKSPIWIFAWDSYLEQWFWPDSKIGRVHQKFRDKRVKAKNLLLPKEAIFFTLSVASNKKANISMSESVHHLRFNLFPLRGQETPGWFSAIFHKGDNVVIFSQLSCTAIPFWKMDLKEKNFLPEWAKSYLLQ